MTATANDILKAAEIIRSIDSKNGLLHLSQVIKQQWKYLEMDSASQLTVGQMVKFMTRQGQTIEGQVTKINTKTVNVRSTAGTQWKVSPSLLTKVA